MTNTLPPLKGDKYDDVVRAIRACNEAVARYEADRWRWLPWRDARHYRRIQAARNNLRLARVRARMGYR